MANEKRRRAFISYSRINKEFATRLVKGLRAGGYPVWFDLLDIPTGSRWDDEVEKALRECSIFMIILTPASITSENVKDEIGYAIDHGKRILPILLEQCDVPLRLRRFQYVDFTTKSFEEGFESAKDLLGDLVDEASTPLPPKTPAVEVQVDQKVEEEMLAQVRAETERKAKEEADRLTAQKAEAERVAKAKAETERKAKEESDRLAAQKAEADQLAKQKVEDERLAKAKAKEEADRLVAQKAEADRLAKQKVEDERLAKAKAKEEADRLIAQKVEADRLAKQKVEDERLAKAKAKEEADRLVAQKAEADRLAKQKAEDERLAKVKAETERKAKEEADRLVAQKAEAERKAKEKVKPVGGVKVDLAPVATTIQKKPVSKGSMIGIVAVVVLCIAGIGIGLSSLSNRGGTPVTEALVINEPATEATVVADPPTEAPLVGISPTEAKSAQLLIPVTGPIAMNTLSTSEASQLYENTQSFNTLASDQYGDQYASMLDSGTPIEIENPTLEPLRLSRGWCATTQTILEENTANMDMVFEFNGQWVSHSNVAYYDFAGTDDLNGWACRRYFIIVDNWSSGTYSVYSAQKVTNPINDGQDDYAIGTISEVEFVVSIPLTSAQTSTTSETSAPLPAASEYFTEEFDQDPGWNYFLTSGDVNKVSIDFNNSLMTFDLEDLDIYAYYLYEQNNYDDVRIDIRAENRGMNNNNVSLVCRASDKGWYEFSTEGGGVWYLLQYTVDDSNQGNYTTIADGGALALKQGKEVNEYGMICKGNEITLIVNGEELRKVVDSNNTFLEGSVGFNISSLNVTPIIVDVDWFKISNP